MLTELCQELHNWFCQDEDKVYAQFTIVDGVITPDCGLQEGQYYRIIGSVFNDGVHRFNRYELVDETFDGAVWKMRVPQAIIELDKKIDEYRTKHAESPFTSESFGGYSYTKDSTATWRTSFSSELNKWRKL